MDAILQKASHQASGYLSPPKKKKKVPTKPIGSPVKKRGIKYTIFKLTNFSIHFRAFKDVIFQNYSNSLIENNTGSDYAITGWCKAFTIVNGGEHLKTMLNGLPVH
jgi:hypothetical protein